MYKAGQELFTLTGHDDWIHSAAHSGVDGRWIMTASGDGIVQIHTTYTDELLKISDSRGKREVWGNQ